MKTYILQKDLPDVRAGAEFEFSGEPAKIYYIKNPKEVGYHYSKDFVEDNPDWFKLKEEEKRIVLGYGELVSFQFVNFICAASSPFSISAERLEEILIAERKGELMFRMPTEGKEIGRIKLYTEKELLEPEERAFRQSRLVNPMVGFKYETFTDYKNEVTKLK